MFVRTLTAPEILLGDTRLRLSRKLASQTADAALHSSRTALSDIRKCPLPQVLDFLERLHAKLDTVDSVIEQTSAIAKRLGQVEQVLKGQHEGSASPMVDAAVAARSYATALRAAQPDAMLDDLDETREAVATAGAALVADLKTARSRRAKFDLLARECVAIALSRSDQQDPQVERDMFRQALTNRRAEMQARGETGFAIPDRKDYRQTPQLRADVILDRYELPEALEALTEGLQPFERIAGAEVYLTDRRAAQAAQKAARRKQARRGLETELQRIWA